MKRLEEEGIGRPSTYAPTIATIQRRGYVFKQGKALVPSFVAFAVTDLLREHFSEYVDFGFTARMEDILDDISNGKKDWIDFLREFYRGGGDEGPGLESKVQQTDEISYPIIEVGTDPTSDQPICVRIGRYGPFLQRGEGGEGNTASLPDDIAPAELTVEKAVQLLNAKADGPRALGTDPKTGQPVYLLSGRFGPYVQLGETPDRGVKAPKPPRSSLPSAWSDRTLTLDDALKLLSLPREVGTHPADGQTIVANFGRFGPYVKRGDEFRSLESDADVFSVSLDAAVELFNQPKRSRARRSAAKTVLKELGTTPDGAAVKLFDGRYGPYVSDGTTNASLPKGTSAEALTLEQSMALIRERAASGGGRPKRRTARASSRRRSSAA